MRFCGLGSKFPGRNELSHLLVRRPALHRSAARAVTKTETPSPYFSSAVMATQKGAQIVSFMVE